MASYQQRLKDEIARRDIALANVKLSARDSAVIVSAGLENAQCFVRAELDNGKAFIREQIHTTGILVHHEVEHAGSTFEKQIDHLGDACSIQMNRANAIVREHPWRMSLAALLAGFIVAPMLKPQRTLSTKERTKSISRDLEATNGDGSRQSRWTPFVDACLEQIPGLIANLVQSNIENSGAEQKPPAAHINGKRHKKH